jgi:hypothetical protein
LIDDDFQPDRLQLRALGHLLIAAQNHPAMPGMREGRLYEKVFMGRGDRSRADWLEDLVSVGLVKIVENGMMAGDAVGWPHSSVFITPAGAYYSISRSFSFAENAKSLTDDFPDEIVDMPFVLQSYYSVGSEFSDEFAPAADRLVNFDDNKPQLFEAISAVDAVITALAADNEIGAKYPDLRDEKLNELKAIREILDQETGWRSKVMVMAYSALGYLIAQFADRPVGALADEAWRAMQTLMGM